MMNDVYKQRISTVDVSEISLGRAVRVSKSHSKLHPLLID